MKPSCKSCTHRHIVKYYLNWKLSGYGYGCDLQEGWSSLILCKKHKFKWYIRLWHNEWFRLFGSAIIVGIIVSEIIKWFRR